MPTQLLKLLKGLDIKIKAKISNGTKLFGKVTLNQFMSAIKDLEIDKSFVNIPSAKEIGKYGYN